MVKLSHRVNYPLVLLIQDTTILNFSGQKERQDIGPIQQDNVRGIFLHPMLAVTPQRQCLGVVDYEQWFRENLKHETPKERKARNRITPLKDKESFRWLNGYRKANRIAKSLPENKFVYIADREGDLYEIFQEAHQEFENSRADFIIRGTSDRAVIEENCVTGRLKSSLTSTTPVGTMTFLASSRTGKKRAVTQNIFAKQVTLRPPKHKTTSGQSAVTTTAIIAREESPPAGEKAIEWLLLTSISVSDLSDAMKVIEWYLCRWQIEIFFKILKSGCKIEKIQLAAKERFDPCLAMYLIIAWRILFLTTIGRATANIDPKELFDPIEWQTAYIILHKKPPPQTAPPIKKILQMIAQLGGFLARKGDGEPGPSVMWKGLQSLYEYIKAKEAFEIAYAKTYG